jgi:beta-lactamase regulating signal transducer with metallopeptidase domain
MSGLTSTLNALSARWAAAMWPVVWQTALLALAVLMLTLALRRGSAAVRFWLWMLVPLRLLAMPMLSVSLPVLPAGHEGVRAEAVARLASASSLPPARAAVPAALPHAVPVSDAMLAPSAAPAAVRPTGWSILMALWGLAACVCLARILHSLWRLRRDVRRLAAPPDPRVADAARAAAEALGLRRLPKVLLTPSTGGPMLWGLIRPAVVLPAGLAERMPPDELRAVLVHEFAHLRRRDVLWGWLIALCEPAYFFHPAFHLAKRRLVLEREMACDDCVLALGKASCGLYARTLISAAQSCGTPARGVSPVVTAAESFEQLKARFARIFADLKRTARLSKATVAALLLLAAVAVPGIAVTARAAVAEELPVPTGETATFAGAVTDVDGQPIAGVQVRCDLMYGKRRPLCKVAYAETRTDDAGRFTFGPLPVFERDVASYFLVCRRDGYAIGTRSPQDRTTADPGAIHIKLTPPGVVSGRVTNEAGKGIPGATVEADLQIFGEGQAVTGYLPLMSLNGLAAETDAEGRFAFRRVPQESRGPLTVRADGYATYFSLLDQSESGGQVRTGDTDIAVVLKPGGAISGRLTLGGRPYEEADIPVLASTDQFREMGFTDKNGRFTITGLAAGTYSLAPRLRSLPEPDIACAPAAGIGVKAGETVKSVEIALFKGPVMSGVVLDDRDGKPAPDVFVQAYKGESTVSRGKTGPDGRYYLPLPPGEFEIGVQEWTHNGFRVVRKPVDIMQGEKPNDVDFSVCVRQKFHGRLVDSEGRPVRGTVRLGDTVKTAEDGTFSLPEPFGSTDDPQVGLAFDSAGKLGRGFLWRRSELGKELELVLEPLASLKGRFADEAGRPIADIEPRLHIALEGGSSVVLGPGTYPWRIEAAEDGSFTVTGVPVGLRVQVSGEKPGFSAVPREHVEPAAGETLDLGEATMRRYLPGKPAPGVDPDAEVEWNAVLAGRLLDEKGKPVPGSRIWADTGPGTYPEDTTDRRGRFRLEGLPTGRLIRLTAYYPGYGHTSFRDVRTGQEKLELSIFPQGYEWYGKPAPSLVVQGWVNSEPVSLKDLRGKVVLLQVGIHIAHYSTPAEQMRAALAVYGDQGLALVAIHQNVEVSWPRQVTEEEIASYLKEQKITWPVALDAPSSWTPDNIPRERVVGNGATYAVYDVKATPALYLIDRKGILRTSPTERNLNEWIEKLLAE